MYSLRLKSPPLYEKMIEIFAKYHLHPFDIVAEAMDTNDGLEIHLRLPGSEKKLAQFQIKRGSSVDDEKIYQMFDQAANECQKLLISSFYQQMIG